MDHKLRIFLAVALAAVAVAALYFTGGLGALARIAGLEPRAGVKAGFVGIENFGNWRLICVPGPDSLKDLTAVSFVPSLPPVRANACRVNQELSNPALPKDKANIVLAVNFSLLGDKRTPAMMIRLPAAAKPGDVVRVSLDNEKFFAAPVRACSSECLAAGPLSKKDWLNIKRAETLQIAFPVSDGQAVLMDVPMAGLRAAIPAMEQAQSAPRS